MQRKKGSNWIEMIIKMVNEFKLTVVHFARPNPMQICACAWIYRWTKKLWKIRTGPPGLRAARQPGRWGPGLRTAGRGPAFRKTHFKCKERESLHRQFQKLVRSFFQQLSRSPIKYGKKVAQLTDHVSKALPFDRGTIYRRSKPYIHDVKGTKT